MLCYAETTKESDLVFWVSKQLFRREFDQADFILRDVAKIQRFYLSNWFESYDSEKTYFLVPTVHIVTGHTQFINGRHRTAVLFGEIDSVPMAFAEGEAQRFAQRLDLQQLDDEQSFELPHLPMRKHSG